MIVYEVRAIVRDDLTEAYERYMRDRHIPDLMETGSFVAATFERAEPGRYAIRYSSPDRETLDQYLAEHAHRLRTDLLEHFPEGIELSRTELEVIASFA